MTTPKTHSLVLKPLVVAAAFLACESIHATLLYEDGFNYSTGNLGPSDTAPNGNAWTGGNSHITVNTGNLSYNNLQDAAGGNSLQVAWASSAGSVFNTYSAVTSGNIYYSFLLNCTRGSQRGELSYRAKSRNHLSERQRGCPAGQRRPQRRRL